MPDRPHLPALTGLRFVAAAAVALAHLPHLHTDESIPPVLRRLFAEGFLGVPFFFVLSGFVLAYTYGGRFPTLDRTGLATYYTARVARIGPVHWLMLAVALLLPVPGTVSVEGPLVPAATALFLQTWTPDPRFWLTLNPVSWSLAAEAWFYLWLPVFVWWAARRRWSNRQLILFAAGAWAVEAAAAAVAVAWPSHTTVWFAVLCPLGRSGEFVVGCALGLVFARARSPSDTRPTAAGTVWELAVVSAVVGLVLTAEAVPLVFRQTIYYTPAMAAVVYVFARQRGVVSRLLAGRIPVYLGEISYSFFMVHVLVFTNLSGMDAVGPWGRAALHLIAVGLAAAAVHRWFETPIRFWATRKRVTASAWVASWRVRAGGRASAVAGPRG